MSNKTKFTLSPGLTSNRRPRMLWRPKDRDGKTYHWCIHFIIYIYINSLMSALTRAIILRIKDKSISKPEVNQQKNRATEKGEIYYIKFNKRHGIANLKPRNHYTSKAIKLNVMSTIVYKILTNKKINKEHWEQETYPIAIDICCLLGTLHKCNLPIQDCNWSTKTKHKGTGKFRIED